MSTPKLYRVTVEVTGWVMVLASSKHEAEQFAANDYDVERCELSRHEADVLATAERWREAGCVVAISEAEPLPLSGWHHHRLGKPHGRGRTFSAQKAEWLTLSAPPVGVLPFALVR